MEIITQTRINSERKSNRQDLLCGVISLFLFFLSALILSACDETSECPPVVHSAFQASTPEECIEEKECVWFALSHLIQTNTTTLKGGPFKRWRNEITVRALGDPAEFYKDDINDALAGLSPYFPYPVRIGTSFNTLIVFSHDFRKDIVYTYRDSFKQMLGSDVVATSYFDAGRDHQDNCFIVSLSDKENNAEIASVIFVRHASAVRKSCLIASLFHTAGLRAQLAGFPFSVMSVPEKNDQTPTTLDRFLLSFIYDDRFSTASDVRGTRAIFDQIYPALLKKFQDKNSYLVGG